MGSYNVACSISNISIGCGTRVVYIPLLPNVYARMISLKHNDEEKRIDKLNVQHFVGANSNLIYPYCYYWPFALPIRGKYNDYGGIDNIVRDATVETLEKFFGLEIDELMDIITHESAEEKFAIKKYQYPSQDAKVTPKDLVAMDFIEEKEEIKQRGMTNEDLIVAELDMIPETIDDAIRTFYHPKFENIKVVLSVPNLEDEKHDWESYNFEIVKDGKQEYKSYNNAPHGWTDLRTQFKKLTNFVINVPEDKQLIVQLLHNLSGMFVHAEVYESLATKISNDFNNPKKVSDTYVKENQLTVLGFLKVPESEQWVIDSHHKKLYRKEGFEFDVKIGDYGGVIVPQRDKEYAKLGDKRFVRETRALWEKHTKTKVSDTFPEPKLKTGTSSATDAEWKAICDKFEELTGVKPGYSKNSKSFYRLKEFKKHWEAFTGDIIDISIYDQKSVTDDEYDDLQTALIAFEEKKKEPSTFETRTYPDEETQKARYNRLLPLMRMLGEKADPFVLNPPGDTYQQEVKPYDDWDDPFSTMKRDKFKLLQFFKEWDYFQDLYYEPILNNELRVEIEMYRNFYHGMYATNNFFFPAMNGEQCGDHIASKVLYETALKITKDNLQDYDDEDYEES